LLQGQTIVGLQSSVLLHSANDAAAPIPSYPSGYLDIVPDAAGYNHIALFSPSDAAEPVFLTSGEWEVDGGIEAVDIKRGLV
jgi:dipeptidyl aminopeptidase